MSIRDRFDATADPASTWKREGLPDPGKLARLGIRTRESLDWMAAEAPKDPAPEYHIDDPDIRADADAAARAAHRAAINRLREGFRNRSLKGREDFGMARDLGAKDRGRER